MAVIGHHKVSLSQKNCTRRTCINVKDVWRWWLRERSLARAASQRSTYTSHMLHLRSDSAARRPTHTKGHGPNNLCDMTRCMLFTWLCSNKLNTLHSCSRATFSCVFCTRKFPYILKMFLTFCGLASHQYQNNVNPFLTSMSVM